VRVAISLIEIAVNCTAALIFNFPPSSNTSTLPVFQYVSMETFLDEQYENSY